MRKKFPATAFAVLSVAIGLSALVAFGYWQKVRAATGVAITFYRGDGKGNASETDDTVLNTDNRYYKSGTSDSAFMQDDRYLVKFPNFIGNGTNHVPHRATINSAYLRLTGYDTGGCWNAYPMLRDWDEGTLDYTDASGEYGATYLKAKSFYDTEGQYVEWGTAGADSTTTDRSSSATNVSCVAIASGTTDITITSAVQSWVNGSTANYGVILINAGSTANSGWRASEYATTGQRPQLVINYDDPAGGDVTAPSAVSTLAASAGSAINEVTLTWTAPYDDAPSTGTVTGYDVRYSTSAITTDSAFASAAVYPQSWTPAAGGAAESRTLTMPVPAGTTYYFAIKAYDENGNYGALSNNPSAASNASATTVTSIEKLFWRGSARGNVAETDDAGIYAGAQLNSYGTTASSSIGNTYPMLMKFPNAFGTGAKQIPYGATVASASITLTLTNSGNALYAYKLKRDWVEGTLDSARPTATGQHGASYRYARAYYLSEGQYERWGTAGAANTTTDRDGTKQDASASASSGSGAYYVTITNAAQDWANRTSPNYGVILQQDNDTNDIALRNSDYSTVLERPVLAVIYTPPSGADATAPGTISNLAVGTAPTAIGYLNLTWTAPPDDSGGSGTVTGYDVRYSTSNITNDSDFQLANVYPQNWTPAAGGAAESKTIQMPGVGGTTYYFAIKAFDEAGNVAAMSNVVSGATNSSALTLTALTYSYQKGDGGSYSETDDAIIFSTAATTNYGTTDTLAMTGSISQAMLYQFPNIIGSSAGQVPSASTVSAAGLCLYGSDAATQPLYAYQLLRDWHEGNTNGSIIDASGEYGVTWNSAKDFFTGEGTDVSWGTAGAENTTTDRESTKQDASQGNQDSGSFTCYDITEAVGDWVEGSSPNYGMLLKQDTFNSVAVRSSEYTTQTQRPLLFVEFTPPDTTAPAAIDNLAISNPTTSALTLTWTEQSDSGDETLTGNVSSYLARRASTTMPDDTAFGNGTAIDTSAWTPLTPGSTHSETISGLSPNTLYYFAVKSKDEVPNTSSISNSPGLYTLANVPGTPTIGSPTTSTLGVTIDVNGNPSNTVFAIQETGSSNYVQANGSLGASAVWQSASTWGTVTVTGLSVNTQYTFKVKARTGDSVATAFGSTASAYTAANTPGTPTVNGAATTTLNVTIATNSNPASTTYAIQETGSSNYIQANGSLGASAIWQSASTWGTVTVTGLSVNTQYTFKVKARNGDSAETAFGSTASAYTLANAPSAPSVTGATTSTVDVAVNVNSNPSGTTFAIQESTSGNYVQANGTLSGSAAWQTAATWGTTTVTGLSVGTIYTFRVKARNGDSTETSFSGSASLYTLANAPGTPTVNNPAATTLNVTIATNSNPSGVQYAIQETGSTNYVQGNGSLSTSAVWQSASTWGTVTVTGLSVNTSYTFKVKARNTDLVETAFGSTASAYTLANAPGTPTVGSPTTTTLAVTIATNSNPASTTYAIQETGSLNYVQANGSLGASAVWQTNSTWGTVTVTGLSVNTSYMFKVKARNGDSTETAFSSTASKYTLANTPSAPTVNNATITTLDVTINVNSNPSATTFAIQETGSGNYVQANGSLGASAIWQTNATWATVTVTGLTGNTTYTFKVKARNGDSAETAFSSTTSGSTILGTDVVLPSAIDDLALSARSTTSITITWTEQSDDGDESGSNSISDYVVKYSAAAITSGNFSSATTFADGISSFSPGTTRTLIITGLSLNTRYWFAVKSLDEEPNTSAISNILSAYTSAAVPSAPSVESTSANTANVLVNANGNPIDTEFALYESSTGKYVQAYGGLAGSAAWQTKAQWANKLVEGLAPATTYSFQVKARNGDSVETALGSAASVTTRAASTGSGSDSGSSALGNPMPENPPSEPTLPPAEPVVPPAPSGTTPEPSVTPTQPAAPAGLPAGALNAQGSRTGINERDLVKLSDDPRVYFIERGLRRYIPDERTFIARGYLWSSIRVVASFDGFPEGVPLPAVPAVPPVAAIIFPRNFGLGAIGADVRLLQQLLASDPALYPEGRITGTYGNLTRRAVERFQLRHRLAAAIDQAFGYVGPKTRAKLIEVFRTR